MSDQKALTDGTSGGLGRLNEDLAMPPGQCPAGRVFQYQVGSGRVLDKIPGIGSGSGRVGVSKYTIGYFRVSLLLSGIFGYFGYFRVISGIFGYFRVFLGISGIYGNVG